MNEEQNYEILIRFHGNSTVAAHIKKIVDGKISPAEELSISELKAIVAALSE